MSRPTLDLPQNKAGQTRRLVAIIADNSGTETTDLVIPFGIIKESGSADVIVVSTRPGIVKLLPALQLQANMTIAEYDDGDAYADVLIVPAMNDKNNPTLLEWVRKQANQGSTIVTICDGAWVAALAGILNNRSATTHWFSFGKMKRCFPKTRWLQNQRYVIDGNVMTTAGVTASVPASLALVEALAGHSTAEAVARRFRIDHWDTVHDSSQFGLTMTRVLRIIGNSLPFWNHEVVELPIEEGFDEINLAFAADAWSRTYCSQAIATGHSSAPIQSRRGLVIIPDGQAKPGRVIMNPQAVTVTAALNQTLAEISTRYGSSTADIVAVQLEYPMDKRGRLSENLHRLRQSGLDVGHVNKPTLNVVDDDAIQI